MLERYRGQGLPVQIGVWLLRVTVPLALLSGGVLAGAVAADVGAVAAAALVAVVFLRPRTEYLRSGCT